MIGSWRYRDVGGLATLTPEKINWFVEHDFEPKDNIFLKDLLFTAIKDYCLKPENRLNISIGKSTSALMIADLLTILEESEIHLGFSSIFRDPISVRVGFRQCDFTKGFRRQCGN